MNDSDNLEDFSPEHRLRKTDSAFNQSKNLNNRQSIEPVKLPKMPIKNTSKPPTGNQNNSQNVHIIRRPIPA